MDTSDDLLTCTPKHPKLMSEFSSHPLPWTVPLPFVGSRRKRYDVEVPEAWPLSHPIAMLRPLCTVVWET